MSPVSLVEPLAPVQAYPCLKCPVSLVNSGSDAGIAFKGNTFGAEEAATTLATNFAGTRAVCEHVLPLIPERGRIVNVCRWGDQTVHVSGLLPWRQQGSTSWPWHMHAA